MPPKRRFFPVPLVRRNPSAFIRLRGIGGPEGGFSNDDRGPVKTRAGFTRFGSSFFQGGGTILSAVINVINKEQKRIAMELKR